MGKSLYQSHKRTLCEIPVEDFMNENPGIVVVHDLSLGHWSLTNLSHRVLSVPRTSLLHNIVKCIYKRVLCIRHRHIKIASPLLVQDGLLRFHSSSSNGGSDKKRS